MNKFVPILCILGLVLTKTAVAGGLQDGTDAAETFKDWLFGFLGVLAFIYLMWKGLQAWAEKIQWFDFLTAIGKVAGVGGVLVLTGWAWTIFA